jgi:hypothetical protein
LPPNANNTDNWQTVTNAWGKSNDAEGSEKDAEESAWELANPDVSVHNEVRRKSVSSNEVYSDANNNTDNWRIVVDPWGTIQ